MNKKFYLSDTELEIMHYIWSLTSEVTSTDIREHFSEKHWSKQSVNTFLKRLVNAKVLNVRRESLNKYFYSAALTEEEYSIYPSKEVLKNIFNNSLSSFACALVSTADTTDEDIRQLEELLSTYKKRMAEKQAKNDINK